MQGPLCGVGTQVRQAAPSAPAAARRGPCRLYPHSGATALDPRYFRRVAQLPEAAIGVSDLPVHDQGPAVEVLHSEEDTEGARCVDIFVRPDGSFGFKEFRADAPALRRVPPAITAGSQGATALASGWRCPMERAVGQAGT